MFNLSKISYAFILPLLVLSLQSCTKEWETVNPVIPHALGNVFVYIETPAQNSIVIGSINVNVEVYDDKNEVSRVELYIDQQLYKTWENPPYEVIWTPSFTDSSLHQLYAIAIDGDSYSGKSPTVQFLYRNYQEPQIPDLSFEPVDPNALVLKWTDKYGDETAFIIEEKIWRSLSDTTTFLPVALLPVNTIEYIRANLDTTLKYSYRVKAIRNDYSYPYSNQLKVHFAVPYQFRLIDSIESKVFEIEYLTSQNLIAGWGALSDIILYSLTGTQERVLHHSVSVDAFAVSSDETIIATSAGEYIRIWNAFDGSLIRTINAGIAMNLLCLSDDNSYLVSISGLKILVWDMSTGALVVQFANNRQVTAAALSTINTTLITGDHLDIKFWNFLSGSLTKTINVNPTTSILALEMTSNGEEFASAGYHLKLWNYPDGSLKSTLSTGMETYLKYSDAGTNLLSCRQGNLEIWNPASYIQEDAWYVNQGLTSAAFGPDDCTIITAGDMIRIWGKHSEWLGE